LFKIALLNRAATLVQTHTKHDNLKMWNWSIEYMDSNDVFCASPNSYLAMSAINLLNHPPTQDVAVYKLSPSGATCLQVSDLLTSNFPRKGDLN